MLRRPLPESRGGGSPNPKDKGKGKGKGKDKGGKKQGNLSDGGNTDASGSESSGPQGKPRKKLEDYPGKPLDEIPKADRCCLHYCWVKPDGTSLCWAFNKGKDCKNGPHQVEPTKAMKQTRLFNRLKAEHGPPNCPANGPKATAKKD